MGRGSASAPDSPTKQNMSQKTGGGRNTDTTLALAPLQRVSSTLQDVRRNGETLLSSAQTQLLQKFPKGDDLSLLSFGDATRRAIRKSASEANLQRPRFTRALSSPPRDSSGSQIDWLGAFNDKINQARDKNRPKFQLPTRFQFEEQVSYA